MKNNATASSVSLMTTTAVNQIKMDLTKSKRAKDSFRLTRNKPYMIQECAVMKAVACCLLLVVWVINQQKI